MQYVPAGRRPVLLRLGGTWRTGRLDGWQRERTGWTAYVWYPTGPPAWSSAFTVAAGSAVRDASACEDCPAAQRVLVSQLTA
ncbi:hypothetical protein [Angustibacter peucedani]